ncbi:hypothetical protein Tco_1474891 [Tanacetum coccineum]
MLRRVDDYVRSEEAFRNTELPKGEFQKKEVVGQWTPGSDRPHRVVYGGGRRRPDHRPFHRAQERHTPYVAPHRSNNDFRRTRENKVILTLGSLISTPAEILATEHHLNLPQPAPESWMNVPITFPPVPARDLSDEALVMEAEIEGYLVKRIHIDKGASVEIMYEHCFNMLHPKIKARLAETQTTVSGY